MEFPVLLAGMTMGLSLIMAIGAQNAFVLRQGLRDEHVFAVCLRGVRCSADRARRFELQPDRGRAGVARSDHALWGRRLPARPWREEPSRRLAVHRDAEGRGPNATVGLFGTLLACLAITWLNPHV